MVLFSNLKERFNIPEQVRALKEIADRELEKRKKKKTPLRAEVGEGLSLRQQVVAKRVVAKAAAIGAEVPEGKVPSRPIGEQQAQARSYVKQISGKPVSEFEKELSRKYQEESINLAIGVVGGAPRAVGFDASKYVKDLVKSREVARIGEKLGIKGKVSSFLKEAKRSLVDTASPIEDTLRRAEREKKISHLPSQDITSQIDRVLRAPSIAGQFARDNGLEAIIRKADNLDELEQYLLARRNVEVSPKGIQTGRNLIQDQKLVESLAPKYEQHANVVSNYSRSLLNYSVDSGLISSELAATLKKEYPNYVPMRRIFNAVEEESIIGKQGGVANISSQTVVQRLKGSEREIESPIASLLQMTEEAFRQGERNKTARLLTAYRGIPGNPFGLVPLRTAKNVTRRREIYSELKELRQVVNTEIRKLRSAKKFDRRVESQLNAIERELTALESSFGEEVTKFFQGGEIKVVEATARTRTVPTHLNEYKLIAKSSKTLEEFKKSIKVESAFERGVFERAGFKDSEKVITRGGKTFTVRTDALKSFYKTVKEPFKKTPGGEKIRPEGAALQKAQRIAKEAEQIRENKKFVSEISKVSTEDAVKNLQRIVSEINELRRSLHKEARALRDVRKGTGESFISLLRNGIQETWLANPDIARAAKNLNVQQMNVLGRIFALPTRIARIGITGVNLPFTATNIARDQVTAFINSKAALRSSLLNPSIFLKALFSTMKHGELYDEMLRSGALGTSFDLARGPATLTVKKIRSQRNVLSSTKYTVLHPGELLRKVENLIGRSEEFTRKQQFLGERERVLKLGLPIEEARIAAAKAAQENTVNFLRRGEWGTVLNSTFLYLNANIQGTRTFLRAMRTRPKATTAKITIAGFLPLATITMWNMKDPERRRVYEDIGEFEKERNLIIVPHNTTKDSEGRWEIIKVPISQEITSLMSLVRRPIESAFTHDPIEAIEMAQKLIGVISPIEPTQRSMTSSLIPQALKPAIEVQTNQILFTGKPIVGQTEARRSPEQQFRDYTGGTARILGKQANISPLKIEAFVKETFGGLGSQTINASDHILAGLKIIPRDQIGGESIRESVVRRFSRAYGGDIEQESSEKLKEILQRQEDERFILREEAELLNSELKRLPREEANERVRQMKEESPELVKKLKDVVDQERKGLTYPDRLVLQLGVENGERAQFIFEAAEALSDDGARNIYLRELRKKGILTDEVKKQVKRLVARKRKEEEQAQ